MQSRRGKAVVLVSGGLDSAVTLAIARSRGYEAHALTFRYGQRHAGEVAAARRVAAALGAATHKVIGLDLRAIGGSALTDSIPVPKGRSLSQMGRNIPSTYVPARNTIFLACAIGWAEVLGAEAIFLGVNALDYSGYPDCRPEYIRAFQRLARLATKTAVEGKTRVAIRTPLIRLTKSQIIRKGMRLGVNFALTHSCYDPRKGGASCRECDACLLREKGFREAGVEDPLLAGRTVKGR